MRRKLSQDFAKNNLKTEQRKCKREYKQRHEQGMGSFLKKPRVLMPYKT